MYKLHERVFCLNIFIALIPLSRSDSFVTVTEDEAVQLDFPYPCDSIKVTLQSGNRDPFYSSTDTSNLHLPNHKLRRFSVTDENCSIRVEINPVKRRDKAMYICIPYTNDIIQSSFIKTSLVVNYPPGDASCTFSIDDDEVGDWVTLQCRAHVGRLAGGIYCYQDSKRLPPQGDLIKTGKKLEQTILARKEYPIFCCSSSLDRPKDLCECNDFVWDPSYTENILNPCPVTTTGQGAITKGPEKIGDHLFNDTVNPSTANKNTNNMKLSLLLWAGGIAILILVTALVIVTLYHCHNVDKTNKKSLAEKKEGHPETKSFKTKVQERGSQTTPKVLPILPNRANARRKPSSWGYLRFIDIEISFSGKVPLKAKSMGTLGKETSIISLTDEAVIYGI